MVRVMVAVTVQVETICRLRFEDGQIQIQVRLSKSAGRSAGDGNFTSAHLICCEAPERPPGHPQGVDETCLGEITPRSGSGHCRVRCMSTSPPTAPVSDRIMDMDMMARVLWPWLIIINVRKSRCQSKH